MTIELEVNCAGAGPLETETGTISDLRIDRTVENVFWLGGDREGMAAIGAFAAALGLSGPAAGLAMMSAGEMEEPVTKVEFRLGNLVVEGLLWHWPFNDGDFVRVVGSRDGNGKFFALSVLDEKKRLIVLYPHVSAGSWAHWRVVAKFSLLFSVFWCGIMFGMLSLVSRMPAELLLQGCLAAMMFFCIIGYRIGLRFVRYTRLANSVFATLGWPREKSINLRRTTRLKRREEDHADLGDTYFRY